MLSAFPGSRFLIPLIILLLFSSCRDETAKIRIIYSPDEPIGQIAQKMHEILKGSAEAELIISQGSIANVDSLQRGSADLAIIENHTPINGGGITSVLPLYPQILHILYRDEKEISDFRQIMEGKKVFIGVEGSGTYRFMMDLFRFFEVDQSMIQLTDNPFDMEVYCSFGDILKDENLAGLEDFKLYSFDHVDSYGKGSIAEAISLKYPQLRPFVIPKNIYRQLTPHPVLTIAVDAVLVSREDLPEETVYQLTKTLFQNHQEFNAISPLIALDLTERFDPNLLNFPLHEGSRQYLEKDEPTFFEKYAEMIGVVFSIVIALVSGLFSLTRWRKQAKKDRIDIFYAKVISVKNEIRSFNTTERIRSKIRELHREQDRAFQLLIDEKLQANESFRIYMELNKEIIHSLLVKARALKKAEAGAGKVKFPSTMEN